MNVLYLPYVVRDKANASKVRGVDVSKWQGEMNWNTTKNSDAEFAIIRAGSISSIDYGDISTGQCYTDDQFERNSVLAQDAVDGVGYYWYIRPNFDTRMQADYFCNLVHDKFCNIALVMDCEENGGLSPYYVEKRLVEFVDQVRINLGWRQMVYSNIGWWHPNVVSSAGKPLWAAALDLWVANYTVLPSPLIPVTWSTYKFWQYTSKGDAKLYGATGSQSIDLNWFNGNYFDFKIYLGDSVNIPSPSPSPSEPSTDGKTVMVAVRDVNIRSGPGVNYSVKGMLKAGDEVEVFDVSGSDAWVMHDIGKWSAAKYSSTVYLTPKE